MADRLFKKDATPSKFGGAALVPEYGLADAPWENRWLTDPRRRTQPCLGAVGGSGAIGASLCAVGEGALGAGKRRFARAIGAWLFRQGGVVGAARGAWLPQMACGTTTRKARKEDVVRPWKQMTQCHCCSER